jgi:hypothetical protein
MMSSSLPRLGTTIGFSLVASLLLAAPAAAAPDANAGLDVLVECANGGAVATLDGTASTLGPTFTLLWTAPGIVFDDPTSPTPMASFPLGATPVTLTVTETPATGPVLTESDEVLVVVEDTTPPAVSATPTPGVLWPPNHRLETVDVEITIRDACDPPEDVDVELLDVESNEPDDGIGDGNTTNDIQGADTGTDDRSFAVRAERAGPGSGRVYTATYRVTDGSGNPTQVLAEIEVPHDQGGGGGGHPGDLEQAAQQAEAAAAQADADYQAARTALAQAKADLALRKKLAQAARKEAQRLRRAADRAR